MKLLRNNFCVDSGIHFFDNADMEINSKDHPKEVPVPARDPETVPTPEPIQPQWPVKEPEVQPEREPLTVPPNAPPEVPQQPKGAE
jgi:hypothetical protein